MNKFKIEANHEQELNRHKLSQKLRAQFRNKKNPLSMSAKVTSKDDRTSRWLISDRDANYIVRKGRGKSQFLRVFKTATLREPISSAIKKVYLLIFSIAAYKVISQLLSQHVTILDLTGAEHLDMQTFTVVYLVFCVLVGIHIIRIYVTMEMLEDPLSKHHFHYISNLGHIRKFCEQLIRIYIYAIVSFEIFPFPSRYVTAEDALKSTTKFLFLLYAGLICWDFLTLSFGKATQNQHRFRVIAFMKSFLYLMVSIAGLIFAVLLYSCTKDAPAFSRKPIGITVSICSFAFVIFMSLLWSFKEYSGDYFDYVYRLITGSVAPYYGERA